MCQALTNPGKAQRTNRKIPDHVELTLTRETDSEHVSDGRVCVCVHHHVC